MDDWRGVGDNGSHDFPSDSSQHVGHSSEERVDRLRCQLGARSWKKSREVQKYVSTMPGLETS